MNETKNFRKFLSSCIFQILSEEWNNIFYLKSKSFSAVSSSAMPFFFVVNFKIMIILIWQTYQYVWMLLILLRMLRAFYNNGNSEVHDGLVLKKIFWQNISQILRSSHQRWFQACIFIKKETLAQVFPCEFCEMCEHLFYRTRLGDCFSSTTNTLL